MPLLINGVETLYNLESIDIDEQGRRSIRVSGRTDPQGKREVFRLYAGDSFHVCYATRVSWYVVFICWLTGQPITPQSVENCNCRWIQKDL